MLRLPSFGTLIVSLAVAATSGGMVPPAPAVPREFDPPKTPIDPRIDPSKITEQSVPQLAQVVAQPLRVMTRISTDAAKVPMSRERFDDAQRALERGLAYLRTSQRPNGAWMERDLVQPTDQPRAANAALAVTAMGAKAFLQAHPDDETARRALTFVIQGVRDQGYEAIAGSGIGTYVVSAVLSALAISEDRTYHDEMRAAVEWLKTTQWDQSEGLRPAQDWFGGAGYGRNKRPDLSNTQLMLDALHDAGISPDDPTVQKALAFVSRAQNLPATNEAAWARSSTASGDGGFIYTPANGGESFASDLAGEGRTGELMPEGHRSLRSYGSMTYAGFKSLLYAGLTRDDERVKAAFDWVCRHYTFDENPGLGQQGLYYYYHAMARALVAAQQATIPPAPPASPAPPAPTNAKDTTTTTATATAVVVRNWRDDLVAAIVARQRDDGSWINAVERWEESQPDLATIYALLALEEALKPVLETD
ncbi:MAG: hypothetical protein SGJ11_11250 [Phycisphaerae bacterium]|nr:hypothetical protein [Phycisphaerae bacterium]